MNDDGSIDVFVRQSWLNEYRDCPEKARYSIHHESTSTDLTVIGTAVHAAAEAWIRDNTLSVEDLEERAAMVVASTPIDRYTKYTPHTAQVEASGLARAWWRGLRQYVVNPQAVEHDFTVLFATTEMCGVKVNVYLKGTIDLVNQSNLFDWKTSRTRYSVRDKQLFNIQASVYAAAAQIDGMLKYPIDFNFGVVLRASHETQVVTVRRDASHEGWLRRQVLSAVRHHLMVGNALEWPTNDSSGLCSPDWCAAWDTCKGAHVAYIPYPTRSKQ